MSADEATEILTRARGLREKLRKYEEVVIKRALSEVNGSITHAASLLEINYQSLAYIIEEPASAPAKGSGAGATSST